MRPRSSGHRPLRSTVGLAALALSACATEPREVQAPASTTSSPNAPVTTVDDPFPDEATLAEIAARPQPAPEQLFARRVAAADAWTLHGPGATETSDRAYAGPDRNAKVLATVAADYGEGRQVTAGMQCYAEEYGRFVLAHGDPPAQDIAAFMAMRCGTTVLTPAATAEPTLFPPDGLALPRDADGLGKLLAMVPRGAHMGVWLGREGKRTMQAFAFGVPEVELEPVPVASGADGFVTLRGRITSEFDGLVGYTTQGELRFGTCRPLPGSPAAPPAFALRCPVSPQDEHAVVELLVVPRGRVLGRAVARVLVSPRGAAPTAYRTPSLALPIAEGDRDATAMVTALNTLRRRAGLRPASVAAGQTEVVQGLLPHLVAAMGDPSQAALADQIGMGISAGRRVEGTVRSGRFTLRSTHHDWPLARELGALLSSPITRAHLFDPDMATAAWATLTDPSKGQRLSVLASYRLFVDRDYTPEIGAFFDLVDLQRAVRGLEPVVRVDGPNDRALLQATAARVRDGQLDPLAAMDELLQHYAAQNHRTFQGTVLLPYDLEGWAPELQGDLVTARRVAAAVAVGHWDPPGSAWGRQLVLVVFTVL